MATLTIDAYDLGDEFLNDIKCRFGVTVKDSTGAPWSVVFEGELQQLQAMHEAYWPASANENHIDIEEKQGAYYEITEGDHPSAW